MNELIPHGALVCVKYNEQVVTVRRVDTNRGLGWDIVGVGPTDWQSFWRWLWEQFP